MYEISRQHILQISYINRNVRTLPTHKYIFLIPYIWYIPMEQYFPMHLYMKVDTKYQKYLLNMFYYANQDSYELRL